MMLRSAGLSVLLARDNPEGWLRETNNNKTTALQRNFCKNTIWCQSAIRAVVLMFKLFTTCSKFLLCCLVLRATRSCRQTEAARKRDATCVWIKSVFLWEPPGPRVVREYDPGGVYGSNSGSVRYERHGGSTAAAGSKLFDLWRGIRDENILEQITIHFKWASSS